MAEEEETEKKVARKAPVRSASRTRKARQADHDGNRDARHDGDRRARLDGSGKAARDPSQDGHGVSSHRRQRSDGRLNAVRAARLGLGQVVELTGKEPAGVAGVERSENGWTVGIEVIEDRRIPSSTDVMALYQADLGEDGELVGYRRIRRYKRGQGDTEYGGESW